MTYCQTNHSLTETADRFEQEQMFEEDVRAVLTMLRPNRRERLMGWQEHRTGGAHFRATVSWSPEFADESVDERFTVPRMVDVLEAVLIGSVRSELELPLHEEFDLYRGVVRELYKRVNDTQSCYE
ncbi:MAG TPA: hypothetical protein VGN72_10515 [Tepidisphaeraceae bacterium]|jgi:hypothetical protein|nr:hypothetical protein [Tepidisphaeraceae bacterium]